MNQLSLLVLSQEKVGGRNVEATIRFRRPTLMLRLSMVVSQHSIIAFELGDTKLRQENAIGFLKTVSVKIREENQISGPP